MKFGIMFFSSTDQQAGADKYRLLKRATVFADQHDFCAVWTPERHFGVVTWLLLAAAFFVGVNLARPVWLWWGIAAAGAVVGLSASAEALGWEPRVFDVDDRLSGTYGSPAYLGAAA